MDDEVNLENLDSLPDVVSDEDAANGDIPVAQQVPAPQADHQADEAEKTAAAPADEALQGTARLKRMGLPRLILRLLLKMPVRKLSRNSPRACAHSKASGTCCTRIPVMRSA